MPKKIIRGWKTIALLSALAVSLAGLHIALNTNLLGRDQLCDRRVSAKFVEAAFAKTGSLSDEEGPTSSDGDPLLFDCTIVSKSVVPGSDDQELFISVTRERADFPFTDNGGPDPANIAFFSGNATGAVVDDDRAWVWLPASCATEQAAVVRGDVRRGQVTQESRMALVRLLVDTANRLVERTGCSDTNLKAPTKLAPTPRPRTADPQKLCGITGLSLPTSVAGPNAKVQETLPEALSRIWSCSVTLEDSEASVRESGYLTFSVVQDPVVLASLKKYPEYSEASPIPGWKVSGVDDTHVVADCAGKATYFSMRLGQQYFRSTEQSDSPKSASLFKAFTSKIGTALGCPAITGPSE
ncbi:hypothetical protein AMK26_12925 [Streptomyces sp. CB03234]|uniref:hypothetical protein n=1 Tax=Streptomyces sp. (strain CB03234) TaxID=1703937 RepID=UPI000938995D|nr:hypothetical protein [Streptomyces sp. CB03234]OKK06861.1 hypothetical protein AMK26_12925 [Streptomyces sp. CB03234]